MTNKRLALIAAIQTASRQRDGGTYRPQIVSRDVCMIVWEQDGQDEIACIVEIESGNITWNADSPMHGALVRELGKLDMKEQAAGRTMFRAAKQALLNIA